MHSLQMQPNTFVKKKKQVTVAAAPAQETSAQNPFDCAPAFFDGFKIRPSLLPNAYSP